MKKSRTKLKKIPSVPLGVIARGVEVCMLVRDDKKSKNSLKLLYSQNGVDFIEDKKKVSIKNLSKKTEKLDLCEKFSISQTPNGFVMTYVRSGTLKKKKVLVVARSKDLYSWKVMSELPADDARHTTMVYDKNRDMFELYKDGLFVKHQSSFTMTVWKEKPTLLFTSRNNFFDAERISIIGSIVTEEGIVLLYDASVDHESKTLLQAGAIIFDIKNPKRILWRSPVPVWQGVVEMKNKKSGIVPLGFASLPNNFIIYWVTKKREIIVAKIPKLFREIEDIRFVPSILNRARHNPILEPRASHHVWEGEGTFNPTAVEDDEGIIHILYRAIGNDGISRVGYAKSKDGMYFEERSHYPVFEASSGFGLIDPSKVYGPVGYSPAMYTSGGSWTGAEDPRAVRIDDTIYMTYVAFEGWGSMRIALTSISLKDFKAGKWSWRKPRLISPPGKMAKNWLIFPEKINGKYAILHGIVPEVIVDYVDDLDNFKGYIHSDRPEGAPQPGRMKKWDNLLRGGGPPPLRTEMGWLLLYHALDKSDSSKYKIGAMILDLNDPTKVLYRSNHPLLCPDMHYENNGKPGIVYASGAVIRGDDLYVYYGGADKVCCIATTNLKDLLKYLKTGNAKVYKLKKA